MCLWDSLYILLTYITCCCCYTPGYNLPNLRSIIGVEYTQALPFYLRLEKVDLGEGEPSNSEQTPGFRERERNSNLKVCKSRYLLEISNYAF